MDNVDVVLAEKKGVVIEEELGSSETASELLRGVTEGIEAGGESIGLGTGGSDGEGSGHGVLEVEVVVEGLKDVTIDIAGSRVHGTGTGAEAGDSGIGVDDAGAGI